MLASPGLSAYNFTYDNWGANPATTFGTSVTPGATNAEGTFTQVASSANIAQDCYWMHVVVHTGATSGAAKNHLLDIGVDPAGGTSYTAIITNLDVGASPAVTVAGSKEYVFPFYIKSGSSVAVRIQGSNGTAGTVRVAVKFWGQPTRPEVVPVGSFSETFGTITNSNGNSFTPGNAADGSWVDLGTTTNPLWWFQIGTGLDNTIITAEYTYVDVAWGDASNKHLMFRDIIGGTTGETTGVLTTTNLHAFAAYNPVPAGTHIYIRGRCNNAPDTGYHATVIGIGG